MRPSTEHEKPLLNNEEDSRQGSSFDSLEPSTFRLQRRSRHSRWLPYLLTAGYIPLIALCFFLYFARQNIACEIPSDLFPSLAKSNAVEYETRTLDVKIRGNPFVGDPSPELDAAWHDMFEDIRLRVSSQDLEYYNLTSIPLADGSGYAAELGVHHELHCLKKVRHWIYKDYYLINETEAEMREWKSHIDHCLEMMRETIMCRGDPSLSTFKYVSVPGMEKPALTAVAKGTHRCVNWGSLVGWVRENNVPIFEEGVLEGPS